jgi:hypothetical protein
MTEKIRTPCAADYDHIGGKANGTTIATTTVGDQSRGEETSPFPFD